MCLDSVKSHAPTWLTRSTTNQRFFVSCGCQLNNWRISYWPSDFVSLDLMHTDLNGLINHLLEQLLQGKSISECKQKIASNYPSAFKFGMVFWPTANMINFRYISPAYRVLYVSLAGLLWNTFIRQGSCPPLCKPCKLYPKPAGCNCHHRI